MLTPTPSGRAETAQRETRAEMLARWQSETPARIRPLLEKLRLSDGCGEGIVIGPSVQDMCNAASMGRF